MGAVMEGMPTTFWGKCRSGEEGRVVQWHPLVDHCCDVAACCEALLERTLLRRRLACLGGSLDLESAQVSRLAVLAALHDVGKFNRGFQNKAWPGRRPTAGHVQPLLALICSGFPEEERLEDALGISSLSTWCCDEEGAFRLFLASAAHHGRPLAPGSGPVDPSLWRVSEPGWDPFEGMRQLARSTHSWFPEAFSDDASPLPSTPAFQHAFSGLVTLADWLGSDTRFFPYADRGDPPRIDRARVFARKAVRFIGLDPFAARAQLSREDPDFQAVSPFPPRPVQECVGGLELPGSGSLVILEAETGSGKTEAALLHFLRLFHLGAVDGLYFALPTRTAATQIFQRVIGAVSRAFPDETSRPPVTLAVPGYLEVDERTGQQLPGFEVLWPEASDGTDRWAYRSWAAEHPKRYLAGSVVVGTIDQVLLSTLMVNHSHLRATSLLRHLLVVDEVHASDTYMTALLEQVLHFHQKAGGHALLMSATLGSHARHRFLNPPDGGARVIPSREEAQAHPYPSVNLQGGGVHVVRSVAESGSHRRVRTSTRPVMADPGAVALLAVKHASQGAKVLVIRNTVTACVETQAALEVESPSHPRVSSLNCGGVSAPHHSRFAKPDREALDQAIEDSFGKEAPSRGMVAVATQTVQQSLDLDADLLLTDLCPADVLLQRVGRLHRHPGRPRPAGYEEPQVYVLTPPSRDLGRFILEKGRYPGEARGPGGIGTVYPDLRILEATWKLIEAHPLWVVPDMCRMLVESSTHPDALARLVGDLGGPWPAHAMTLEGQNLARQRLGKMHVVPRDQPFADRATLFPSGDLSVHVKTRLGEGDRHVRFPEPLGGPFGLAVRDLRIPAWLVQGAGPDAVAEQVTPVKEGGFRFTFGTRELTYDRWGLRPVRNEAEDDLAHA